VSQNLLKSLRRFYIVILQHQVIPHAKRTSCGPIVAKQHYCIRSRKQSNIISEFQLKLQKHVNFCCCSFNKIRIKIKKKLCYKNIDLTINFDLMINFVFSDLITLESLMASSWNLVCGRFINFKKGKKLTLLTFSCPNHNYSA